MTEDLDLIERASHELEATLHTPAASTIVAAAGRRQRRRRVLGTVAAVVALVGLGTILLPRIGQQDDRSVLATEPAEDTDPPTDSENDEPQETTASSLPPNIDIATPPPLTPSSELTSSPTRPTEILIVRDGTDLITTDGIEERLVWRLERPEGTETTPPFVESVEPVGTTHAIVGICCEPASGLQMLVEIESGNAERLPLSVSFPSVSHDRNLIMGTSVTGIEVHDLEPLMFGISAPAGIVADLPPGPIPRPLSLPNQTVLFSDSAWVSSLSLSGETLASVQVAGVRELAYDERNQVVVAIAESGGVIDPTEVAADTLLILHPETLEIIETQTLPAPTSSIDVSNGWLLLAFTDGPILARSIGDAAQGEVTIFENGSLGAWPASEIAFEDSTPDRAANEQERLIEEAPTQTVEVPRLSGALIDDAVSLVEEAGLVAQIVVVNEATPTPEHVISTEPPVGTQVDVGSTVILTMQAAVDEPEDPEGAALIALQNLIDSEADLFVGYYIDETGAAIVATSPEESEAQERLGTLSQDYETLICSRSRAELTAVIAAVQAELQRMNVEGASAFGIDAKSCAARVQASLTAEQQAALVEQFGDAIAVDPDFIGWTR